MNYTHDQFKDGQRCTCVIYSEREDEEYEIVDGKIGMDSEGNVYICQNEISGSRTEHRHGYEYSWRICDSYSNFVDGKYKVTNLILEGVEKVDTKSLKKKPITIGVDPELALEGKRGALKHANEVFKPEENYSSDFGFDGNNSTAEIRSSYSKYPENVVKNLKDILEKNKKKYPEAFQYNMKATSKHLSLGGHIHFGHPLLKDKYRKEATELVRNLDFLLAFPSLYLDDINNRKRRARAGFGRLGDVRSQSWGIEACKRSI